jgi:ParB family chromosome partitioning protein
VREADDRLVAELAIVENLQRKDLNPIEKAMSFRRYLDEHRCSQEELARRLKIDRSTIANLMRLLELPDAILDDVQTDRVSAGHARALLPLGDESLQLRFCKQIKEEQWSVRETERRVSEFLQSEDAEDVLDRAAPSVSRKKAVSPQIASLEQEIRSALGTKVEIKQNSNGRGRIVVQFGSEEEFERIRELLLSTASGPRLARVA